MEQLPLTDSTHLLVLTGAGVSAESGVATFRAAEGLWESHRIEDVASPEGFWRDPQLVWRFYSQRRRDALAVEPNAGHLALAGLEGRMGDRMLLVTQNVDGLHRRAGSRRVVEMHGSLMTTRCSRCSRAPYADRSTYDERVPRCGECEARGQSAALRPHIVWFGEAIPAGALQAIDSFLASAGDDLLFLAAGTSGTVYPAAALVDMVAQRGGRSVLVNLEEAENASRFDHLILGKSGEILPRLLSS